MFRRVRSDGSPVLKKNNSQKVLNMREAAHTHSFYHPTEHSKELTLSQTHTHFSETADVSTGNS